MSKFYLQAAKYNLDRTLEGRKRRTATSVGKRQFAFGGSSTRKSGVEKRSRGRRSAASSGDWLSWMGKHFDWSDLNLQEMAGLREELTEAQSIRWRLESELAELKERNAHLTDVHDQVSNYRSFWLFWEILICSKTKHSSSSRTVTNETVSSLRMLWAVNLVTASRRAIPSRGKWTEGEETSGNFHAGFLTRIL